VPISRSVND
jgi:hypothetical protein